MPAMIPMELSLRLKYIRRDSQLKLKKNEVSMETSTSSMENEEFSFKRLQEMAFTMEKVNKHMLREKYNLKQSEVTMTRTFRKEAVLMLKKNTTNLQHLEEFE